jgi:hypothetical protein
MNNIGITKDCIQTINDFGKTTYVNICNGNINYVNWGAFDWVIIALLMAMLLTIISIFVWVTVKTFND